MRFLRALILIGLAYSTFARADMEFLGAPSPGDTLVDLQARGSLAPEPLAGTVRPPTLVMNGRPAPLESTAEEGGAPGVTVDGVAKKTTGKSGRFFFLLSPEESVKPEVEVRVGGRRAALKLGRIFLDAPIHIRRLATKEERASVAIAFKFAGVIPPGTTLALDDGRVFHAGKAEFSLPLDLGKAVIVGKLTQPDGSVRNLNVPVEVTRETNDGKRPILNVDARCGAGPEEPWNVPRDGCRLRGQVNPGAKLKVDGTEVGVDRDGSFQVELKPRAEEWNVEFEVGLASGASASFGRRAVSPGFTRPKEQASAAAVQGVEPDAEPLAVPMQRLSFRQLRVGPIIAWQASGGSSYSGFLEWNPRVRLFSAFYAEPFFNLAILAASGGSYVATSQEGLALALDPIPRLGGLGVELRVGAVTWYGSGGSAPAVGSFASWRFKRPPLKGWLTQVFLGDNVGFYPGLVTHFFQAGAGFDLFPR